MKNRMLFGGCVIAAIGGLVSGCGLTSEEFIAGVGGAAARLGSTPLVDVVSPNNNIALTGGTPVEVTWRVTATTNFASVDIIFDRDQDPNNGNEFVAASGLSITQTSALLDTSDLLAGTYNIGVLLNERNELAAFDYAGGRVVVNQRPQLFFTSPRDNFAFDRSNRVSPRFDVAWQVFDPDSTVSVRIFLDTPGAGNGILLRESSSQTGDSFSFDLPTINFEAGTYRILAVVSDGVDNFSFFAPGAIVIRPRLAGYHDLRLLGTDEATVSGAIFEGFNPRDNLGSFVASVRDADNDGFADFVMLAQFGKPQFEFNLQRNGIGEAYWVYGRQQRFSGLINVNSTGRLFRGEIFAGVPEVDDPVRPSRGIASFTSLSDWDQDGVRELAFGLPYVDSIPTPPPPVTMDSFGYFRSGCVVIAAGSVLRPDLGFPGGQVIRLGEIGTLPHAPGATTDCPNQDTFWGPKAPDDPDGGAPTLYWRHRADVDGLNAGSIRLGCRFSSNEPFDQFGTTISTYGFEGIVISAPNRDPVRATLSANQPIPGAGTISIYFNATFAPFYPWTSVNAPPAAGAYTGPVDHPEYDRLPHWGPYHYIYDEFGSPGGQIFANSPGYTVDADDGDPCVFDAAPQTPNAATTVRFWTNIPGGSLSEAATVGDFNSDGLLDIAIGQPLAKDGAGACYLILGRLRELMVSGELQLEELGLPMQGGGFEQPRIFDGIRIVGEPGTRLGTSQDGAGDFNGDGVPDVVIGSPLVNNRRGGATVFFGSRDVINLTQEELLITDLPTRGLGVTFVGEAEGDLAGARVRGVGDIDGDGLDDILIAAPDKSVRLDLNLDATIDIDRQNCGVVYLIYGSSQLRGTLSRADVGTERLPGAVFIGRNSGDFLGAGIGRQGDRSYGIHAAGDVDGDGRADLLISSVSASPRDRVEAGEVYLIYGE